MCLGFTYDGGGDIDDVVLYKDGVSVASEVSTNTTFTASVSSTQNLTLAARQSTSPENVNIAAVKLYNKQLSAAEMLQNYNALKNRFV
mgnify:CR=1 FL=1